jgi:hypothetical protein
VKHPDLVGADKLIGIIVRNKHGRFIPMVGSFYESEGDDDAFFGQKGKKPPVETVEEAVAAFEDQPVYHLFREPIPAGGMMGTWLSEFGNQEGRA